MMSHSWKINDSQRFKGTKHYPRPCHGFRYALHRASSLRARACQNVALANAGRRSLVALTGFAESCLEGRRIAALLTSTLPEPPHLSCSEKQHDPHPAKRPQGDCGFPSKLATSRPFPRAVGSGRRRAGCRPSGSPPRLRSNGRNLPKSENLGASLPRLFKKALIAGSAASRPRPDKVRNLPTSVIFCHPRRVRGRQTTACRHPKGSHRHPDGCAPSSLKTRLRARAGCCYKAFASEARMTDNVTKRKTETRGKERLWSLLKARWRTRGTILFRSSWAASWWWRLSCWWWRSC